MVNKSFDQAGALISRLMEGVGGSADAYEEPLSDPGPVKDEPEQPDNADTEFTGLQLLDDDVCADGMVDWEEVGDRCWTSPPPVTDEYQFHGVVEDNEELLAIFKGFEKARRKGETQMVTIETGTYPVEKRSAYSGWTLVDTVKDRLYYEEHPSAFSDIVDEEDLFLWVTPESDQDVNLGYIHMGYVFTQK